jgi:hypothetical protein
MWGVWDIAHNTPLEFASELGLPLAGMVGAGWLFLLGILLASIEMGRRGKIIPLAALGFSGIGILHSFVDFTLQIPGYSIVTFGLVGAGVSWSLSSESRKERREISPLPHKK